MLCLRPTCFVKALTQIKHASSLPNSTCEIAYIAVEKEFRKEGIGTSLIELSLAYGEACGYKYIQTKTSNQKLFKFYVKRYSAVVLKRFHAGGDTYHVIRWSL